MCVRARGCWWLRGLAHIKRYAGLAHTSCTHKTPHGPDQRGRGRRSVVGGKSRIPPRARNIQPEHGGKRHYGTRRVNPAWRSKRNPANFHKLGRNRRKPPGRKSSSSCRSIYYALPRSLVSFSGKISCRGVSFIIRVTAMGADGRPSPQKEGSLVRVRLSTFTRNQTAAALGRRITHTLSTQHASRFLTITPSFPLLTTGTPF